MTIPDKAKGRPLYKGLLVPFTVQWFAGVPDFKVTDPNAVKACVTRRLCGLCGTKMGERVAFIGGPLSIKNRLFTDPAMHRECALYAYSVCPFLNGDIRKMAETYKNGLSLDDNVSPDRPDKFGLLVSPGFRLVQYEGEVYIQSHIGTVTWLT